LMHHRPARVPAPRSTFAGFRFPPEVITLAVRWYLRTREFARRPTR
jgi:transposase-like protein